MAVDRGVVSAVATNTETVVVSVTPTVAVKLKGFSGSGTAEAWWTLYIGGVAKLDYTTSSADRNAYMLVPDQDVAANTAIELKVKHQHALAQDFRGSLIYA